MQSKGPQERWGHARLRRGPANLSMICATPMCQATNVVITDEGVADLRGLLQDSVTALAHEFEGDTIEAPVIDVELPLAEWKLRLNEIVAFLESSNLQAVALAEALVAHTGSEQRAQFDQFLMQVTGIGFRGRGAQRTRHAGAIVTMEHILESWLLHANRRPKILIADDQPTNIRVLYELFRDQCDVFMATTGAQTMQICRAELPDLILLDVVMDDIDGHEVCRRLKADPLTGAIPIIFVTSQNQEADEVIALGLGAVDFITKPINPVIVRARVRTHLTLKLQGDLLRASALLDGLTGVANRRKFDEDVQTDWRQCLRESAPLSLILIDIDYFKLYNDRYGHQAGDNLPETCRKGSI